MAQVSLEVKPLPIPDFIHVKVGKQYIELPLGDLDEETLNTLILELSEGLMAKAEEQRKAKK